MKGSKAYGIVIGVQGHGGICFAFFERLAQARERERIMRHELKIMN